MTSVPNTLLIDGNDLRDQSAFPGLRVYGDMNLLAPGTRRGSDQAIPGRYGEVPAPNLPVDAYNFSVFVIVQGATRGEKFANIRAAALLLHGNFGLVTLHRRLANAADTGYDEFYAQGRFNQGLAFQTLNKITGKAELQFRNLDGGWRRVSDNGFQIP